MAQYQLLPSLSKEEYDALRDDIARRGVMVPIEYDEKGNVLDGHHRLMICKELGITTNIPSITRIGMSEDEKVEHVLALNLNRRHLTQEQQVELEEELRVVKGYSYRRIGKIVGKSHVQVFDDLEGVRNLTPATVTGKDGKVYPARKSTFAKNKSETQRVFNALADLPAEALPNNMTDVKRLERIKREYMTEERRRTAEAVNVTEGLATLLFGDFREQEIADNSVDLIFTDPPYPQEYLPLWTDLSLVASRVLKPGGLLIAYSGSLYLPEVMSRLGSELEYVWLGALILPGQHSREFSLKINSLSKPLLFYGKAYQPRNWIRDTYFGSGKVKDLHDWQQAIDPALYYIGELTEPGEVVLDPFLGSGTTGLAAVKLGRRFIGCENDKAAFEVAKERILNGARGSI